MDYVYTALWLTILFFLWYFIGLGLEKYFNYLKKKEVGYVRNRLAILDLFLAVLVAVYIDNLFSFTDLIRR